MEGPGAVGRPWFRKGGAEEDVVVLLVVVVVVVVLVVVEIVVVLRTGVGFGLGMIGADGC